jgi:hypothetical protein
MNKQNLYLALLNAAFGVALSLLLQGNLLIYGLAFVALFTILLLERHWIYEKVFRQRFWWAVTGYAALFIGIIGVLSLVTQSNRDRSFIIKTTHDFIDHLKPGEYDQAYALLSEISKKSYPLESFVKDNQRFSIKVQDFRIDGVEFNEFDKTKAVVKVSSPFLIYGQSSMAFEFVKEDSGWRLVFTPSLMQQKSVEASSSGTARTSPKRHSTLGGALRSLF